MNHWFTAFDSDANTTGGDPKWKLLLHNGVIGKQVILWFQ